MKKSFFLIEVIISAILASLVGLVLLQSQANNTNLLSYILTKKDIDKQGSFVVASLSKRESASDKNIYELLNEAGFMIDNDDIATYFKEIYLDFEKTFFTQITLQGDEMDDDESDTAKKATNKSIIVNQIDVTVNGKQTKYFTIELQN
jgi:hypothetical protein